MFFNYVNTNSYIGIYSLKRGVRKFFSKWPSFKEIKKLWPASTRLLKKLPFKTHT